MNYNERRTVFFDRFKSGFNVLKQARQILVYI